jgi:hypothetical protein
VGTWNAGQPPGGEVVVSVVMNIVLKQTTCKRCSAWGYHHPWCCNDCPAGTRRRGRRMATNGVRADIRNSSSISKSIADPGDRVRE